MFDYDALPPQLQLNLQCFVPAALRTIDPGCSLWLVRINVSGIAWARARDRASGARIGDLGGVLRSFIVFV